MTEIHSIHRNTVDSRHLISLKEDRPNKSQKETGKLRIQCLDGFCVFLPDKDGKEMKWRTKKARELFAYLFHLQGNSVSREVLIELLWPESGMKSAIALFHTTLYSIRQSFVPEGLDELISYENKKYSLNMQLVASDLTQLNAYMKDLSACENNPEQIIKLYTGSYMGNSGYLWSYGMAKELENQYLTILRSGAAKRTAQNRHEAAVVFFQRILEADPYNEDIVRQLIISLYKSGKQAEAKQQYDRIQKLYQEDLELDFTSSFQEIVAHV
ncbi:tetratricopeptide repeat protein [Lachnospiraceae bacterium WCA-9-b2]|uniref:Tetratricopeptide repeat protein n=1 Tax=Sporofaciens musculi TaxID=2681861 RepID=A0A7X3SKQ4_9FIRM|nr:BTAD domain-containing putative transcriptional regulator [Sporofaciens musculi]MXP77769.1 tetratricopeptide repeat protein [Sporofaciens musculi]